MGSNPFVNPNQRGVDLPPGAKDLMDVLKFSEMNWPPAGLPTISYGPLSEVPHRIETFLESGTDTQLFSAGVPGRDIFLILLKPGGADIEFFRTGEPTIGERCREADFSKSQILPKHRGNGVCLGSFAASK
jgi:hypothetical protein